MYNFNNVIDARGSQVGMLQRIYGQNNYLLWEKTTPEPPDPSEYESQYLTFEIVTSGYITLYSYRETYHEYNADKTIQYSINNSSWISKTSKRSDGTSVDTNDIIVNAGDKVRFKGSNSEYWGFHFHSGVGASWKVYGNIMSLIYGDDFVGKNKLTEVYAFREVFNEGLSDAPHPLLNCENLVLPALVLARGCYNSMFEGCVNITKAPILPARTIYMGTYANMFARCSNLSYIKCLANNFAETLTMSNWVNGVASTGTFIKAAGATWSTGTSGIPTGWTVQNV